MVENPVTCGNCGVENEPGADVCMECGLPLTRSAEQAMVASEEAQEEVGLFGGGLPGDGGAANSYVPNTDTPARDGLPTD